jgi:phosphate transport system protein
MEKLNLNYLTQHTSSPFNRELEEVRNLVLEMGGLAEKQVREALQALFEGNSELADKVADADSRIDKLEIVIDEGAVRIFARRQPAAFDLRTLLMVIKTIADLERIGDEAKKIARMATTLAATAKPEGLYAEVRRLGDHVRRTLHRSLDAYARMEVEAAIQIIQEDIKIDQEYEAAMQRLMEYLTECPESMRGILAVIWCTRALERIGDHAKNIAKYVIYMVKGKDIRHLTLEEMEQRAKT